MAITKIRIARGLHADLPVPPNAFEAGRPYFATDIGALYIGTGLNSPMVQVVSTPGGDVDFFEFIQSSPLASWVITHNLGLNPAVVVSDSTNTQVFVETHFDTPNQVTLKFSGPESGTATLIG